MKRIIFIILAVLSACNSLKKADKTSIKQAEAKIILLKQFKRDTLQYIKTNFIKNQSKYIDKELKVLIDDLGIPVKSYVQITYTMDTINGIYLAFQNTKEYNKKNDAGAKPLTIYIKFKDVLPAKKSYDLSKKNNLRWTSEEVSYYGKQIIKYVDIVK